MTANKPINPPKYPHYHSINDDLYDTEMGMDYNEKQPLLHPHHPHHHHHHHEKLPQTQLSAPSHHINYFSSRPVSSSSSGSTTQVDSQHDNIKNAMDELSAKNWGRSLRHKYSPHCTDAIFQYLQFLPRLIVYSYVLHLCGMHLKYAFLTSSLLVGSLSLFASYLSTNPLSFTFNLPLTIYCIILLRGTLGYRFTEILLMTTMSSIIIGIVLFFGGMRWFADKLPRSLRGGVSIGSSLYLCLYAITLILHFTNHADLSSSPSPSLLQKNEQYLSTIARNSDSINYWAQFSTIVLFVFAIVCYIASFILNNEHIEEIAERRHEKAFERTNQHHRYDSRREYHSTVPRGVVYYLRQYQILPILLACCALFYITILSWTISVKNSALESVLDHRPFPKRDWKDRTWYHYIDTFRDVFLPSIQKGSGLRWGPSTTLLFNIFLVCALAMYQIIDYINVVELMAYFKHINRSYIDGINRKIEDRLLHQRHNHAAITAVGSNNYIHHDDKDDSKPDRSKNKLSKTPGTIPSNGPRPSTNNFASFFTNNPNSAPVSTLFAAKNSENTGDGNLQSGHFHESPSALDLSVHPISLDPHQQQSIMRIYYNGTPHETPNNSFDAGNNHTGAGVGSLTAPSKHSKVTFSESSSPAETTSSSLYNDQRQSERPEPRNSSKYGQNDEEKDYSRQKSATSDIFGNVGKEKSTPQVLTTDLISPNLSTKSNYASLSNQLSPGDALPISTPNTGPGTTATGQPNEIATKSIISNPSEFSGLQSIPPPLLLHNTDYCGADNKCEDHVLPPGNSKLATIHDDQNPHPIGTPNPIFLPSGDKASTTKTFGHFLSKSETIPHESRPNYLPYAAVRQLPLTKSYSEHSSSSQHDTDTSSPRSNSDQPNEHSGPQDGFGKQTSNKKKLKHKPNQSRHHLKNSHQKPALMPSSQPTQVFQTSNVPTVKPLPLFEELPVQQESRKRKKNPSKWSTTAECPDECSSVADEEVSLTHISEPVSSPTTLQQLPPPQTSDTISSIKSSPLVADVHNDETRHTDTYPTYQHEPEALVHHQYGSHTPAKTAANICPYKDSRYYKGYQYDPTYNVSSRDQRITSLASFSLALTSFFGFFGLSLQPFPIHSITTLGAKPRGQPQPLTDIYHMHYNQDSSKRSSLPSSDDSNNLRYHHLYYDDIGQIDTGALLWAGKYTIRLASLITIASALVFSSIIVQYFTAPLIVAIFVFFMGFDQARVNIQQHYHFEQHHTQELQEQRIYELYNHYTTTTTTTIEPPHGGDYETIQVKQNLIDDTDDTNDITTTTTTRTTTHQELPNRPDYLAMDVRNPYPYTFFISTLVFAFSLFLCCIGLFYQAIAIGFVYLFVRFMNQVVWNGCVRRVWDSTLHYLGYRPRSSTQPTPHTETGQERPPPPRGYTSHRPDSRPQKIPKPFKPRDEYHAYQYNDLMAQQPQHFVRETRRW
jgi:hypothetical protein